MAQFQDRMTAFTDKLQASIEDRNESIANIHQATADLIGGARTFLNDVAHDHKVMAEELNAFFATTSANRDEMVTAMRESHREFLNNVIAEHEARIEDVNEFLTSNRENRLETVGNMRDNHREELDTMRDNLRQTLDEANKARHDAVDTMTDAYRTARLELSSDLRGAATAWKEFSMRTKSKSSTKTNG